MSRLMLQAINLFQRGFRGAAVSNVVHRLATGTEIQILNKGNTLQKIVTQANGNKIVSTFAKDGKTLSGITQTTPRGKIDYSYGAQNYDKVIQAQVDDGIFFNFLGHRNRSNGILYTNVTGKYGANNKFTPQFKVALDYIRGLASKTQYQVSKISTKW